MKKRVWIIFCRTPPLTRLVVRFFPRVFEIAFHSTPGHRHTDFGRQSPFAPSENAFHSTPGHRHTDSAAIPFPPLRKCIPFHTQTHTTNAFGRSGSWLAGFSSKKTSFCLVRSGPVREDQGVFSRTWFPRLGTQCPQSNRTTR